MCYLELDTTVLLSLDSNFAQWPFRSIAEITLKAQIKNIFHIDQDTHFYLLRGHLQQLVIIKINYNSFYFQGCYPEPRKAILTICDVVTTLILQAER